MIYFRVQCPSGEIARKESKNRQIGLEIMIRAWSLVNPNYADPYLLPHTTANHKPSLELVWE